MEKRLRGERWRKAGWEMRRNKEHKEQAAAGRTALKMDEKCSGLYSQWACVNYTLTYMRKRSQMWS